MLDATRVGVGRDILPAAVRARNHVRVIAGWRTIAGDRHIVQPGRHARNGTRPGIGCIGIEHRGLADHPSRRKWRQNRIGRHRRRQRHCWRYNGRWRRYRSDHRRRFRDCRRRHLRHHTSVASCGACQGTSQCWCSRCGCSRSPVLSGRRRDLWRADVGAARRCNGGARIVSAGRGRASGCTYVSPTRRCHRATDMSAARRGEWRRDVRAAS